ncbi:MAG: hypothetical protein IJJ64_14085 [Butyrivibrio sp.]|uniref:hypothetical protein n=1 Tax=Butyrivibrio sp. AE3004 TaxID=1506994 RepID=UPI00055E75B6|nr:hypothetical protein [Butyrivibrio sp. AE3004]MBQ6409147.1 hypothetical protein [Butyrivibrio sp.]
MIFSKDKPKNCRGCAYKDICNGIKRECVYRQKFLEACLGSDYPCHGCPYGREHRICFPCYKNLLGQTGIKEWKEKHPKICLW